ncbi:hypothetical protein VB776_08205 [Arcicella sp. DC2W]|uniref:Secreted protein n=1 Tax=Arcicella gelida TaxID=2984195 RepID=A0ABU5S358_9BACT|nr:hypothetical protein [Arcicella sp. DC2W]MEA5402893.1 hypothetical protein [Arcicella sp. DC2W]
MLKKNLIIVLFFSLLLNKLTAQSIKSDENTFPENRILIAPESVFKMFIEAGMEPSNHVLTSLEKEKVEQAFAILPPLYKKVLKEHLKSISFMDNMPNTALTSPIETSDSTKQFNITFRAGILNETISEWATWKEKTIFNNPTNSGFEILIDAGKLDAIQYVLLHEATHVVDAILNLASHPDKKDSLVVHTTFTKNIWSKMNTPVAEFTNPLLENTRFRSGKVQPISSAPEIYNALKKTPFPSLYGMASWHEDIAELLSIYHLTNKLKQPFVVTVKEKGKIVATFEPMKNKLVKKRVKQLRFFYDSDKVIKV